MGYTYKLVKTLKFHSCYICKRDIPSRSFVVQRDERMNYEVSGRFSYPAPPVRAHLVCFDFEVNPQGSGLEPAMGGVVNA